LFFYTTYMACEWHVRFFFYKQDDIQDIDVLLIFLTNNVVKANKQEENGQDIIKKAMIQNL
jgi:hypothetical protein